MVAWVTAIALLSYALAGTPIMFRMAVAQAAPAMQMSAGLPCPDHGGGADHRNRSGDMPLCDHDHCLFCQGGAGLGILSAPVICRTPSIEVAPFAMARGVSSPIAHSDSGYTSRAPPAPI